MVASCFSSKELVKWRPGSRIVSMVVGCSVGPCVMTIAKPPVVEPAVTEPSA